MFKLISVLSLLIAFQSSATLFSVEELGITAENIIENVETTGALRHLSALQQIANDNDNTRAAGTKGYDLSANYVEAKMKAAGYTVTRFPFDFEKFEKISSVFASQNKTFEEDKDYHVMTYSGSGAISSNVVAVDLELGEGNSSTSGCEAEDFADFTSGSIALVQRGTCAFKDKAVNAQNAGATAVIIFNQGNSDERKDLFQGTLGNDANLSIPVFSVGYDLGVSLQNQTLEVAAQTIVKPMTSYNIIADHPHGASGNLVMLGAHLDSVPAGPGINDNGSGSAAILEAALLLKDVKLNNKLRFAWWGAEELGLVGSTKYVEAMTPEQLESTKVYLNFDMVGSPNFMLGVFDADGSKFGLKGPKGSVTIERLFQQFYQANGTISTDVEFSGRSDYAAFAEAGIPVGGLFTGAEGVKTDDEALLYGGASGVAYDAHYHAEGDTTANISPEAMEINTKAIIFAAMKYGHSTADIEAEKAAPESPVEIQSHQMMLESLYIEQVDSHETGSHAHCGRPPLL